MAFVNNDPLSRFYQKNLVKFREKYFSDIVQFRTFEDRDDDKYVTMLRDGRLDLVAESVYGNPLLWWVIAEANKISDPLKVNKNTLLKVPSIITITSIE